MTQPDRLPSRLATSFYAAPFSDCGCEAANGRFGLHAGGFFVERDLKQADGLGRLTASSRHGAAITLAVASEDLAEAKARRVAYVADAIVEAGRVSRDPVSTLKNRRLPLQLRQDGEGRGG